jgi:hypothetical protein
MRYIAGVVKSVSIWLTSNPPTIAMPNGCLNSDPNPTPNTNGNAPNNAAMVVIIIGLKRNTAAS